MAVAAHYFPVFETQMGTKAINLSSDTLTVGLVGSGTFTWGSTPEAYTYVSQFLAGDGTHGALTEVAATGGTGYARQALTSVSLSSSGETVTLTAANPSWPSATFSAVYGWLYDSTVGSGDSSHPIAVYWDFGGAQTISGITFSLIIPSSGILSWAGS